MRKLHLALEKYQRYGKKVRNWAIRSQAPKPVMAGQGEGSETKWMSRNYDNLASLSSYKI